MLIMQAFEIFVGLLIENGMCRKDFDVETLLRYSFLFSAIILRLAISAALNRLMDNRVINRLIHLRSIVITFPIILRETTRSPSVRLLYTSRKTHETHLMHKYLASIKCLAARKSICVCLEDQAKTCFLQT